MRHRINRLLLVETREYKDPAIRSYTLNLNNESLDRLEQMVNRGSTLDRITDITLAQNLPEAIQLSSSPQLAKIPYGWNTARLRFMMEVESDTHMGKLFTYIQGFTNYFDPSISGMIDPNTIMYFNSVTEVLEVVLPTGERQYRVLKSYNTFSSGSKGDVHGDPMVATDYGMKVIRPLDVVASINSLPDIHNPEENITFDTISTLSRAHTSWRRNNNPTRYFQTTLNAYIDGQNASMTNPSYSHQDMRNNSMSLVAETTLASNPFLHYISSETGMINPTEFTIGFLNDMDPTLLSDPMRCSLVKRDQQPINLSRDYTVLDSDITEELFQPTIETIRAQEIAVSLLDLCVTNFITEIVVSFTNNTTTGEAIITPQDVQCFIPNISDVDFCNQLINHIRLVLMPKITNGNLLLVDCSVRLSLTGDTTVFLGFNGQPQTLFRFPTFADSCFVPVISNTMEKNSIVEDFTNALTVIGADKIVAEDMPLSSYEYF